MTFIKPIDDRVLIKPKSIQYDNGFELPDDVSGSPTFGEIIAVGTNPDLILGVGQTVMFPADFGCDVNYDNQDYIILKQREVLAIIQNSKFPLLPIGANIIVDLSETKSSGILEVVSESNAEIQTGIIMSIGDKVSNIEVGDKVCWDKYCGKPIYYNFRKYLLLSTGDEIKENDIIAKL